MRMPMVLSIAGWLRAHGFGGPAGIVLRSYAGLMPDRVPALRQLCGWALEDGDADAAETLCRRILTAVPDDEQALLHLGHFALARGDIDTARAWFQRHDARTCDGAAETRVLHKQHLDPGAARVGRAYYKRLQNVAVDTAFWSVVDGDVVHSDDILGKNLHNSPWVKGRVSPDGAIVVYSMPTAQAAIEEECILVGGDENYSHWLLRCLLKLSTLDAEGLLDRYPWLVNRDLRSHQEQYLELLGVPKARLLPVERNVFISCRRLLVPALLISKPAIAAGIEWMRRKFALHLEPPESARRLLFVSRRDAKVRAMVNEDEVLDRLTPLGFELFVPGRHSVVEQIRAFSAARLIVAPHGAALANIVFSPATTSIVEIASTANRAMDEFRRIAALRGQRMTTLVSERFTHPAGTRHMHADYLGDANAVLAAVHQQLHEP